MSDVLSETVGQLGVITLNRPKALNALTLGMIREITAALTAWQDDAAVKTILIRGAGERGLCAGGDIRALYQSAREGTKDRQEFFAAEYRMNAQIADYGKPVAALMDGIVMGGGIGISAHASHRVVTERSMLAMPETGIGLFPDVGATYLLSRPAIGELGTHLALSAQNFGADDALLLGMADVFIASDRLGEVEGLLAACRSPAEVAQAIASLGGTAPIGKLRLSAAWINDCYASDQVETILERLQARPEAAAHAAARDISTKSPLSLKQTLRLLRRARGISSLATCLEIEYRAAVQFTSLPDFIEGVRAAVIDKDRNPRWSVPDLASVTGEMLDRMFPVVVPGWQPLFNQIT